MPGPMRYSINPKAIGSPCAWASGAHNFKGEQRLNRSTNEPEWEVEIDTRLGRLWVIVSAPTNPFPGLLTDDADEAVPVVVDGLAIIGWDDFYRRPRFVARSITPAHPSAVESAEATAGSPSSAPKGGTATPKVTGTNG